MFKLKVSHKIQLPSGKALAVAISPDGKICAAGDRDGVIHIIDVKSGEVLRRLRQHVEFVYTVAFCPDNGHLFTAGKDKSIREWDVETGAFIKDHAGIFNTGGPKSMAWQSLKPTTRSHSMTILSLCFDQGGLMATASQDRHVKLWKDYEPIRTYDWHSGPVTCARFQPESHTLYSASRDKTIRSWNEVTGAVIHKYQGHLGEIVGLEFMDAHHFVSADAYGNVIAWQEDMESPAVFLHETTDRIQCASSIPSKKVFLIGCENGRIGAVRVGFEESNAHTEACCSVQEHETSVRCIHTHKSGIMASGDNSGQVIIWKFSDRG